MSDQTEEIKKHFITKDLAERMLNIGFDELCFGRYYIDDSIQFDGSEFWDPGLNLRGIEDGSTPAILWQQAFDWIREKGYCINITFSGTDSFYAWFEDLGFNEHAIGNFDDYNEARLASLKKIIELVELLNHDNKAIRAFN